MPENKTAQSVIDSIAETLEPGSSESTDNVDDTSTQDDTTNQNDGSDNQENQETTDNQEQTDDEKKKAQDAAFAQMRIDARNNKTTIERMERELEELRKNKSTETVDTTQQETTEQEKSDLELRLERLEKRNQELVTQERQGVMYRQIQALAKEYELKREDLIKFAEDADTKGFDLNNSPLSMIDVYRTVYHNEIIQKEIDKVKAQIAGNDAPGPGPSGQTGTGGSKRTPSQVIADIAKKLEK